jgi:nickel-dependent lactate racemase
MEDTMRRISVPYNQSQKTFEVPDARLLAVFDYPRVGKPTLDQERAAVEKALANPIGSSPLADLARPGKRIAILVDDWTRPTPAYRILPVLLERLAAVGCEDKHISIIIAKGMHRRLSREEMAQKVGKDVVERFEVNNHDPHDNLVELGKSPSGTPVFINRTVVEADLRIAVGSVVAHPIAGFGGGAKIIVPGVAGHGTIHNNHCLSNHPSVTIGCVDGNPVRKDMEDIARMVHLDMIVNSILSPRLEIVDAVAGDVVAAHREGVRRYRAIYGVDIREQAEVGVVGASPRDGTFGHAVFALYAGAPMVRSGGALILLAPCNDGPGSKEGRQSFKKQAATPPDQLMTRIKAGEISASGGAFMYVYAKTVSKYRVVLVADNHTRDDAEDMGLGYGATLQEAVDDALTAAGAQARVSVMPSGGMSVPNLAA